MSNSRWLVHKMIVILTIMLLGTTASAEKVTLRFHYRGGALQEQTVKAWISEFEKRNPDIHVEWEPASGNWQDKLLLNMLAGTAPDVTEFWGDFAQNLARQGLLLDLRPYVQRDMSQSEISDIFPGAWRSSFLQFGVKQGMQFSQPRYINLFVTHFNATIFADAGLENPLMLDKRGNWTWQTLQTIALKLTKRDGGKVAQYGFSTYNNAWTRIAQWLWEANGDWFDPNDPTRYVGDQPGAVQAGSFLQDLFWKNGSAKGVDQSLFLSGKIAMLDYGLDRVFAYYQSIGGAFEYNVVSAPQGPAGRKPYIPDDAFGIWSGTKQPEAAWKFLKYLTSKDGQEINIRTEGLAPTRRSAAPAYLAMNDTLNLQAFVESAAIAQPTIANRVAGDVKQIGQLILNNVLTPALVQNKKPFAQAAQEVKPLIEAIIKETNTQ